MKARIASRAPIPIAWSAEHALMLVRRGVLVRTRASKDGLSVPIDCAGPGAFVALLEPAFEIGYAATELLVCLYPRPTLEQTLAEEANLARDVILGLAAALARVERFAEARALPTVDARVARVLAVVAETLAPPHRRDALPAGLQQRDLARLAGVRHESFCRALGKLEREGVVRRRSDGLRIERHAALA